MLSDIERQNAEGAVERLRAAEGRLRASGRTRMANRAAKQQQSIQDRLSTEARQRFAAAKRRIVVQSTIRRAASARGRTDHAARCQQIIERAFEELERVVGSGPRSERVTR